MSDAAIVCSHLPFSWPDGTPVLHDLSFCVPPGRTGLVAPDGSGKSTLLKPIAGEPEPATGSVSVSGTRGHLPQSLPLTSGLAGLTPDRGPGTLSEGRGVSLGLAAQVLRRPDGLLLDEPTDNLDLVGARRSESAPGSCQGASLVVSHGERFLTGIGNSRRLRPADGVLEEAGSLVV